MKNARVALVGVLAVLPLTLYLWGFMVDDAFITARYAANIAHGHGYRFNPNGVVTDGVTPLGFAYLLVPFAQGGPLGAYRAAKVIGLFAFLCSSGLVAVAIHSLEGSRAKWLGLSLMATSVPLAAWCGAGMETGLVIGLAGSAAALRALGRELACAICAALVAMWRPEAIPWAVTLALAPARPLAGRTPPSRWITLAIVALPPIAVGLIRLGVFGHAMPLGAIAKPSTVGLGMRYALACAILCGLTAIAGVRRVPGWTRGLVVVALVHWGAMALAGGDWMPVSRLATTALPTVAIAAAGIAARPARSRIDNAWLGLRFALAIGGQLFVLISQGPKVARVERTRMAVMETLGPRIGRAKTVAALDIGWVGMVTSGTVVDLAGVTDPEIAILDGGHTSKRIPSWLLDAREVDLLVVRLRPGESVATPWYASRFATFVDMWVATTPNTAEGFEVVERYEGEPRYVLVARRAP